jgi:hypothetical protein
MIIIDIDWHCISHTHYTLTYYIIIIAIIDIDYYWLLPFTPLLIVIIILIHIIIDDIIDDIIIDITPLIIDIITMLTLRHYWYWLCHIIDYARHYWLYCHYFSPLLIDATLLLLLIFYYWLLFIDIDYFIDY